LLFAVGSAKEQHVAAVLLCCFAAATFRLLANSI